MNTVELVVIHTHTDTYKRAPITLTEYDVLLNGVVLGRVGKAMITRERKTPGKRYVNARWYSPGWHYCHHRGRYFECASRRDGIERLLHDAGLTYREAEDLSHTAKLRRSA